MDKIYMFKKFYCLNNIKVALNYSSLLISEDYSNEWGPLMVAQWLRYCATSLKVAGSIPDSVIGIFH
jgi:hypothetical protein